MTELTERYLAAALRGIPQRPAHGCRAGAALSSRMLSRTACAAARIGGRGEGRAHRAWGPGAARCRYRWSAPVPHRPGPLRRISPAARHAADHRDPDRRVGAGWGPRRRRRGVDRRTGGRCRGGMDGGVAPVLLGHPDLCRGGAFRRGARRVGGDRPAGRPMDGGSACRHSREPHQRGGSGGRGPHACWRLVAWCCSTRSPGSPTTPGSSSRCSTRSCGMLDACAIFCCWRLLRCRCRLPGGAVDDPAGNPTRVSELAFAVPVVVLALSGSLINPAFADALGWPQLADGDGVGDDRAGGGRGPGHRVGDRGGVPPSPSFRR